MTKKEKSHGRNDLTDIGTKCPKVEMTFGEIFKGRNSKGSISAKVEMTKKHNSLSVEITQNENYECRNDIGTECPKVKMTFGEMYKVRNDIGTKCQKGRNDF